MSSCSKSSLVPNGAQLNGSMVPSTRSDGSGGVVKRGMQVEGDLLRHRLTVSLPGSTRVLYHPCASSFLSFDDRHDGTILAFYGIESHLLKIPLRPLPGRAVPVYCTAPFGTGTIRNISYERFKLQNYDRTYLHVKKGLLQLHFPFSCPLVRIRTVARYQARSHAHVQPLGM